MVKRLTVAELIEENLQLKHKNKALEEEVQDLDGILREWMCGNRIAPGTVKRMNDMQQQFNETNATLNVELAAERAIRTGTFQTSLDKRITQYADEVVKNLPHPAEYARQLLPGANDAVT